MLVVNDDFYLRSLLHEVLTNVGYAVETANDGEQALALLRQSRQPRVMLLDDSVPVMIGPEVLDVLATDPALAERTACVFLTLRPNPLPVALVRLVTQLNASVVTYPLDIVGLLRHAVLVDEAQFLQPAQVDHLLRLAAVHAIPVMAWGLRTDFRTHAFPGSQRLLETAHELRESIAMCGHGGGCEHRAQFNARLVNGRFAVEGDQAAIDGEAPVTYMALCARHYLEDVGPIAALAADAHWVAPGGKPTTTRCHSLLLFNTGQRSARRIW